MTIASHANWNYPTAVRFGPGRIQELPEACASLGIARPLVVTDPGIHALPVFRTVEGALRALGEPVGVFSDIQANPVGRNIEDGVRHFDAGKYDGVIALGGGSALDAAKAIGLMVGQQRPLWDFEDVGANWRRVNADGMAPVIAVPTTSGTGSEVGRASVIVDEATHTKKIIFHPKMLPPVVIADPELTLGLPAHITSVVGMDALSHNLEGYCAAGNHPMADGIALEAIRLVASHLDQAVNDPANLEARSAMMVASLMGATAFQKGLGAMHSMAHVVGGHLNTHHGRTIAVVMPYVLIANRDAIEPRIVRLARHIGIEKPTFDGFLRWICDLRERYSIPNTLADLGVRSHHIPAFADAALRDPSTGTNPRPMSLVDFEQLFDAAIQGVRP
ncbi:MAG: iron-containing alcohol dehydrogenase [Myxococcota bacterium]|nr:iron-containing alcohol dehydrogenase [Myxococcota bacterium]